MKKSEVTALLEAMAFGAELPQESAPKGCRGLPRGEDLSRAAFHYETACPSQLAPEPRRTALALRKVESELRAALPYKALPRAVFKKRSPPSGPPG
jgi:hypothetical protein